MINNKDKTRLRNLAKEIYELANSPSMIETIRLWKTHNACRGERPMIRIELDTFANEIIPPLQLCDGEEARKLEWQLLFLIVNHTMFGDDSIIRDFYSLKTDVFFKPFDIDIKIEYANNSLGHHFIPTITDLEDDFDKIKPSTYGINRDTTSRHFDFISDIIGDILPVKLTGMSLSAVLTQDIVHIMSMEDMYVALMHYPELFYKMINDLADDYIDFYNFLSKEGVLLSTTENEYLGQGTYCYTDELPDKVSDNSVLKPDDVWGYADSQETVGISETTYRDIIFPAYKKVAECYGLLSYGCCEPVHRIWDNCLSTITNLRKLSISPWCDEVFMGQQLANTNIIYHRKPMANYLGVGTNLDEDGVRKYIRKTLDCARDCTLEFTQRDVYTVNHNPKKVKRYVEIIHEEIQK